jgi:predicted RNA-binding protein YlxR (DUF448 family)
MAVSIRTCAGCGRKTPKAELVRFVCPSGELKEAPKAPGRGVYTCRKRSCFERARTTRAFNRTLRTAVTVDPRLSDLYTDGNG